MSNATAIWLAWEKHRRSIEISNYLKIPPILFQSNLPRVFKYPIFTLKTFILLFTKRPSVLIVQNPSIFLTYLACFLKHFFGYFLIVDAHNGGLIPDNRIGKKLFLLYDFWQQYADITIVSNNYLANIVIRNKGNPFTLPDKLPKQQKTRDKYRVSGIINILCICTYGADEPYEELIEAFKRCPNDYRIYMTGDYKKLPNYLVKKCPPIIIFTGFLNEKEYWALLNSVDFVIDLTKRENCLVCGAYEAVSQCKPLILSNTKALREHFTLGSIFTHNKPISIYESIQKMVKNLEAMNRDVQTLKKKLLSSWETKGEKLLSIINTDFRVENIYKDLDNLQ